MSKDETINDTSDMIEGWEMPEAPDDLSHPFARGWGQGSVNLSPEGRERYRPIQGWSLTWRQITGRWIDPIPWPFREGVTVTAEMLRALGFVVEG